MIELHEICRMPNAERIVGIVQYRDDIIVATEDRIYRLVYDGTESYLTEVTERVRPDD